MFSRLFRNRWSALFWASGVVWIAYDIADTAPSPPPRTAKADATAVDVTGAAVDAADLAALANAAP